ncbi:TOBE domain-containing protein [Janibacter hoylei]|uniref:TOBE domain-containing protein n=1 Tax=Janibacter hoylei TaxID=364298 RepID=UPI0021A41597|nr:TOBE domain-containing protein [Janibacter hoylei]MCT1620071.1 TOBE domain-containing protein [Janibacter hoylei]MCT2293944.1 TOBE domain-containing protein [Janibacter hoylei]
MTHIRVSEAAELLAVSPDTVRRWIDAGRLTATKGAGPALVDGTDLARLAEEIAHPAPVGTVTDESARNRMRGIVTEVKRDGVMAQVSLQAGPFRIVSLMSREAADELGLDPGVVAVASIKSTNVVIGTPGSPA